MRGPKSRDGTSYGTPALKVRKKLLVRLREDGDSLVMPGVPQDEREVLIRLSTAKRADVEPLLRRHWRTLASKAAVKQYGNP